MNGIRGKPSTSPPVQLTGQQQILSSVPPPRGQTPPYNLGSQADVYQQSLYQQSQAQPYQQYQLGYPQGYDVGKPNYAAPRMPSPGVANQQTPNMYQSQQTQGMRPTAPFYSGQQQQGIRQRYPSNVQNTQNQNMYTPTGGNQVLFINSQQPFGSQPIMTMPTMMGMPRQQFNPTNIPPQQSNIYQPIQQQPPTTFSQGYGNLPMFYNQAAAQQPPRPQSAGHAVSRQKHVLKITDPNTGKDVLLDNQQQPPAEHSGASSDSGSRSTPVSSSSVSEPSMSQSPHNEIAALFAAKVAATLSPGGGGGGATQIQHRPPSEPSPAQRMQQPPPQHYPSPHDTGIPQQRMMDGGMGMPPDQQQPVHMGQPGMGPPSVPIPIPPNMHHQHRAHQNTPPGSVDPMHMNAPAVMDTDAMGLVIESIEQPPLNSELVVDTQGLSQGDITHMHPMTQQTRFPQNVQTPQMHQLPPQAHRLPQEPVHVPPPQVSLTQPPPSQPGLISHSQTQPPPPQPGLISHSQTQPPPSQPGLISHSQTQPPPPQPGLISHSQPPQQGLISQPPPHPPPAAVPQQVSVNQQPIIQNQPPPKVMQHGQPQQGQAPAQQPQQSQQQPPHMATSQGPPPVISSQLPPQATSQGPPPVISSQLPPQVLTNQPPPKVLPVSHIPTQMANYQPPPAVLGSEPTYSTIHQPLPPASVPQPSKPTQILAPKSQQPVPGTVDNMHEKLSPRRQSEPVVPTQRQTEPVVVKSEPSVVTVPSKQSEPVVQNIPSKQTEPAAQKAPQEPVKQILAKDKSPPPPLSTEKVQEESVSVENVSQVRTSSETSDSVKSDSKESREETPEVNIVPPTPVEKEMKMEVQTTEVQKEAPTIESTENAKEVTATEAPKKSKKKSKDYGKKAQQLAASSDFDAYIDNKPEPEPATTESPIEEEKENVDPANRLSPDRAVPSQEDNTEELTPSDEMVQKVEIKIEDSEELSNVSTDGEEEMAVKDTIEDEVPSLMQRYKYSEEQWSPINPEGKKHYDREFLLQFQLAPEAVVKPPGLPEIPDIILDKPHHGVSRAYSRESDGGGRGQQDGAFDFTPKYMWSNTPGGPKGSRSLPRQPSASKNRDRGDRGPGTRQINISISKDVEPLHQAKDAWKPSHKDDKKKEKETDLDPQTEDLYKKTRSILNKLTPQKFQTLVSQMQALQINTENKLKGVIDLVFEKAISEPNFSVAYANMCRCLSMFKVPSESKPGESVNFRAVLLTRCQREFEKDKSSEMMFIEKRQEIEKADEEKKKELIAELDYEESKAKRRSLGNIRFIGELFKLKMLTENIMHDCVFKLLRTKDPENLECLCRLLTTIGKELETDKARPRMDQYFTQMTKIVNEKKTSSRVRFMLQDVIDLRKGKWVPRRGDNNPKTIEQIHQEAAKEAQDRAVQAQIHAQQKASQKGGGGGRRGPQGGGMGPPSADGWNMVGGQSRTPFKSIDRSIDPTKMKISKQQVDESSIQLGPGGGASRFAGWGRGSTGGGARASQEKERPSAPSNRFSALSKPEEESRRGYSSVSPARGEGRGRGGFGQPPRLAARASQEQEREKAIAAVKSMGISQSAEITPRERSRGREPEKERPSPVTTPQPELPKEEIDKKTKAILDEYLHIQDMKEAITCVKELPQANHAHFCGNALNHVLERSEVARRQTGHFLHDLVKNSIVSVDSYIKGLLEVLEFAEDMEIDIPKIWKYLGELVGQMIQDGSVPLSFLKQAAKPLVASNKAGIFVAEVLHDACHREGHKKIAEFWQSSGLQWTDFLPKNQIEQFLIDKKLEFTKGGDSVPTTPTTGLPMHTIEEELQRLIVLEKRDNESVFDWIESNVDEPTTKRSKFIRALMTCVCNGAFLGEGSNIRVDPKEVNKRHDLLQKYLDHQPESELQALYALQALVTKLEHPPGVLRQMFDTLYDEDIISEDAFLQWEKSDEEPGKGVAMKQVVQFFTWLREAEDDNDS